MAILTVLYPKSSLSQFDHGYYVEKHIPLVKLLLATHGFQRIDLFRGVAAPDGGEPGFEMIGNIHLETSEQIGSALQTHGAEIMADIAKFTNIQPVLQVSADIRN